MLVDIALLYDMYEDEKAFGLWITDKVMLGMYFLPKYEEIALKYYRAPGNLDVDMLGEEEWPEFWDYWTTYSGGHQVFIRGPYKLDMPGDDINAYGEEVIKDLNAAIADWKEKGVFE